MTLAQEYLRKAQSDYRPFSGCDRTEDLYAALDSSLPEQARRMKETGQLAVGEVGRSPLNAQRFKFEDGSCCLILYSGLIDFLEAMSRLLMARANIQLGQGNTVKAAISLQEMVRLAGTLLDQVMRLEPAQRLASPVCPLHAEQQVWADDLAINAALYVLTHEVGHVLIELDPVRHDGIVISDDDLERIRNLKPGDKVELKATAHVFRNNPDLELRADQVGLTRLNEVSANHVDRCRFYAGAFFSLRAFAILEQLGYPFPDSHPPARQRLEGLTRYAHTLFGGRENFERLNRIALALDEMMEALEKQLLRVEGPTLQTPERVLSRICAILEFCATDVIKREELASRLAEVLKVAPRDVIEQAARRAVEKYLRTPPRLGQGPYIPIRFVAGQLLASLPAQLPSDLRPIFEEALKSTP